MSVTDIMPHPCRNRLRTKAMRAVRHFDQDSHALPMDKNNSTDIHTTVDFLKVDALGRHLFAGMIMIS